MECIKSYSSVPPPSVLEPKRALIDECFRHDTVEQILASLDGAQTEFTTELAGLLRRNSPASLKVTLRLLRLARQSTTLEDCLRREYSAVLHAAACAGDLKEGIRAAIIDKDRSPRWVPSKLEDVPEAAVEAYVTFQPPRPIAFHS